MGWDGMESYRRIFPPMGPPTTPIGKAATDLGEITK